MKPFAPRFLPWLVALCAVLSALFLLQSRENPPKWEAPAPSLRASKPDIEAAGSAAPASKHAVKARKKLAATPTPAEPAATPAVPVAPAEPTPAPTVSSSSAPVATPTPTPAPTPEPVATPASQPAPVATPTPAPLDAPKAALLPQFWPRTVVLAVSIDFPVTLNGVQAGSMRLPKGAALNLRKVNADGTVQVERQGSQATLPVDSTNLLSLMRKAAEDASSNPTPAPATPAASDAAAAPADSGTASAPTATPGPRPVLNVIVNRDRGAEASDDPGTRVYAFHIRIVNPTERAYPKVAVRFFGFARTRDNALTVVANDTQPCDVPANGEITVDPAKLRLEATRAFDGYAVLVRDAENTIVGYSTTRDSVTRNWAGLELLPPGSPLP